MLERAEIKNRLSTIVEELKKSRRIDEAYCQGFYKTFDDQSLQIGVVGQMKAGKSSLVNAVVFGRNILPTGMEPVTVTLTEITYGEKEYAEVELLTKQDIEDIKNSANYVGDDALLSAKADSAKETIKSLVADYEKYLGSTTQTINVADLKEYVAAGGKFCGLAKSVKIFYNNDNLKGITIIDTPGFNDPITSRGDTTKSVLSKCHILLFVHNEDGYDKTDVSLLTEQIGNAGISELVDVFNKIDLSDKPIREWADELAYLTTKRDDIDVPDEDIRELLKNAHAFYVSALMALCGLTPSEEMDDNLKQQYGSFEEDFEELCQFSTKQEQQEAFVRCSNVLAIIDEINRLSKDGTKYLVEGPLKTLGGKLLSIKKVIQAEIEKKKSDLDLLNASADSFKKDLEVFQQFMQSVIGKAKVSSLDHEFINLINISRREIENRRDSEVADEFTEEHYPQTSFGSRGITKGNIARYNTFAFEFTNTVRDRLFKLQDDFNNAVKSEVNSLVGYLSANASISKDEVDYLKKAIENEYAKPISNIDVTVPTKTIDDIPDRNQKQWDKLRTQFLHSYDDSTIHELLNHFNNVEESLVFANIAEHELTELKNRITTILNKTPLSKAKEAEALKEEIKSLQDEVNAIDNHINAIEELKKRI